MPKSDTKERMQLPVSDEWTKFACAVDMLLYTHRDQMYNINAAILMFTHGPQFSSEIIILSFSDAYSLIVS